MSTNSLLFHAFGIKRYQLKKTKYKEGKVFFHIEHDRTSLRCPVCDSSNIIKRGHQIKYFKTVPIGLKPIVIVLNHQRVFCSDCQNIRYVKLDFADSKKSYTKKFEQFAIELLKHSTIQDVSNLLGAGWDLIKRIDKENLKKYDKPKLKDVKQIAIDEISIGKGHKKYLTLVMDIEHGNVVHIGDGKGADALSGFWKRLKSAKVHIEAVATDMSPAFISAIKKNLPDATHVVDPFHIIKNYNFELSEFRRELHNKLDDPIKKKSSKGHDGSC